jgi:hypothetical protein
MGGGNKYQREDGCFEILIQIPPTDDKKQMASCEYRRCAMLRDESIEEYIIMRTNSHFLVDGGIRQQR